MSKKDPAFLFYSSDFLTGTMFLSNEQVGIYIRLLCSQHQHGGLIDKISFNSLVGTNEILRAKFIETETGFYNERLANEVQLRAKKSSNMSQTAREIWEKRKAEQTKLEQMQSKSNTLVKNKDTNVLQPEDVNEDEIEDKNLIEDSNKIDFEIFWDAYDKKVGSKDKLKKKWCALKLQEQEDAIAYIPHYKIAQPDKQYRKNPETFLNNKSWHDEIVMGGKTGVSDLVKMAKARQGASDYFEQQIKDFEKNQQT